MSSVSPEKEDQLARRLAALGVRDADIEESFVRSGGHGGQNVNKTSTCVMLLHRPTGLQVKCQATRYQGMNRFLARQLLLDKIEAARQRRAAAERARVEKLRRARLPRRAKPRPAEPRAQYHVPQVFPPLRGTRAQARQQLKKWRAKVSGIGFGEPPGC